MAIHCDDLNLLYLCTEKTGSTSVSDALLEQLGGRWVPADHIWDGDQIAVDFKHSSLNDLVSHDIVDDATIRSMHLAITVRNPFAWIVSGYRYRLTVLQQLHDLGEAAPAWIKSRRWDLDRAADGFDEFVRRECEIRNGSLAGRYLDGYRDHPSLTYLRIESIDDDLNRLLSSLGVGWHVDVGVTNATSGGNYRSMYTDETRAMVEAGFADDLARFDYTF
ncbi:hypothetical protein [Ilumatobacter coccineus]|uniref:Sulfotransferase family protein n=1 Tax=Ilumatobacter coccineus (strain NBRC 103263 / KCTC 29153 / YM16-304) TaxID=1313172 RepID=A0A6C7E6F7_ILUCY|nr:hypothetical protein [Ilumatobacter coccineus]BAN03304.1 hypothetical protein YM304_29900 [Ilumatobacter coccineus YM16-304]